MTPQQIRIRVVSALLAAMIMMPVCQSRPLIAQEPFGDRSERALPAGRVAGPSVDDDHLMREGTLVPSTVGQIVNIGRRWAFIPAGLNGQPIREILSPEYRARMASNPMDSLIEDLNAMDRRTGRRPSRLGASTRFASVNTDAASSNSKPLGASNANASPEDRESADSHILLSENLMLHRIVYAIRADPTDDYWSITGEVTEFADENRLVIRTAQRANRK